MMHRIWQSSNTNVRIFVLALLFSGVIRAGAQDFFAGARGGTSFDSGNQRFYESEAFVGLKQPKGWSFYSDWKVAAGADASAGWIGDRHVNGFIGTLGGFVELHKGRFPLALEVGWSPTLLGRYQFDAKNLGTNLQFTSHVGIAWDITDRFTLDARIQHMSNGGFAEPNPGINFCMGSFRYNF